MCSNMELGTAIVCLIVALVILIVALVYMSLAATAIRNVNGYGSDQNLASAENIYCG